MHSFRCGFEDDQGCDIKQPKYALRKHEILIRKPDSDDDDEDSKRVLRASEVYEILKEINDDSIALLGLDPINS